MKFLTMKFCVDKEFEVKTAQKPIFFMFTTAIAVVNIQGKQHLQILIFGALIWGSVKLSKDSNFKFVGILCLFLIGIVDKVIYVINTLCVRNKSISIKKGVVIVLL